MELWGEGAAHLSMGAREALRTLTLYLERNQPGTHHLPDLIM